ncbi:MAG: VTT domain-containing protein [Microthrixaceae bacterium]
MFALSLNPTDLVNTFGLLGVATVIFAESGLLIGFFLPGDSLLFTAGAVAAGAIPAVDVSFNFWILIAVVVAAAIAGDQVGFIIGRRAGPALFTGTDRRFLKARHHRHTVEFFEHHGPKAIVLARFVPIVRTLCPVVAGIGDTRYRTFVRFNVVGGVLWGVGVTAVGYRFGRFDMVRDHLELTILGVVFISVLPALIAVAKARIDGPGTPPVID